MVDNQRQQAEERALKMKSMLVKTKKELAEAKKQVKCHNRFIIVPKNFDIIERKDKLTLLEVTFEENPMNWGTQFE